MFKKFFARGNVNSPNYKWIALSNTTLGVLMASLNSSILLISLPAIFRGIKLNPLQAGNVNYLLWILMGYMVATAVLVVTFGKLGDLFGRTKLYNLGFAIFTVASVALALTPGSGSHAALYIIIMRIIQGIGGALLMSNATAILTDAFPSNRRGLALGVNTIAGIGGAFLGLIVGGLLADTNWRLVFWLNVPLGILGTIWAYLKLHEVVKEKVAVRIDWLGNVLFAVGLILVLVGITYGIQPYGGHIMGWTSPKVLSYLIIGVLMLISFIAVERRVDQPMFDLKLFRIRPFVAGNLASLLAAIGRGGLQFMLIIWLQGIWLPLHGYSFNRTPLWAGIFMLPLTAGFLVAGPLAGYLSDRFGARPFATGGMLLGAFSFVLLLTLPANFAYWEFALFVFLNGVGTGLFSAPNSAGIMNSVPASERGQASGMRATGMNAGQVLSIGIFFSLIIVGLASSLPQTMSSRLSAQHLSSQATQQVAREPVVGSLFAAFLGYNPMSQLIPATALHQLPQHTQSVILGKSFFPNLISGPFMKGLRIAFSFSLVLFLTAAGASWWSGGKYVHDDDAEGMVHGDEAAAMEEVVGA
jgi:EmrB/QacA subfamily drug resistance transporter